MGESFLVIELDYLVGTLLDAFPGTSALLFIDKHDSRLGILAYGSRITGFDARRLFAVLAHDDPEVFRELGIGTGELTFNPQVMSHLARHSVLMVHQAVVVAASDDACLAADAAVEIDHYAKLSHGMLLLFVDSHPGRYVSLAATHVLFVEMHPRVGNELVISYPLALRGHLTHGLTETMN